MASNLTNSDLINDLKLHGYKIEETLKQCSSVIEQTKSIDNLLNMNNIICGDDQLSNIANNTTLEATALIPSASLIKYLLLRACLFSQLCSSWSITLTQKCGKCCFRFLSLFIPILMNLMSVCGGESIVIENDVIQSIVCNTYEMITRTLMKVLANLQRIQLLLLIIGGSVWCKQTFCRYESELVLLAENLKTLSIVIVSQMPEPYHRFFIRLLQFTPPFYPIQCVRSHSHSRSRSHSHSRSRSHSHSRLRSRSCSSSRARSPVHRSCHLCNMQQSNQAANDQTCNNVQNSTQNLSKTKNIDSHTVKRNLRRT